MVLSVPLVPLLPLEICAITCCLCCIIDERPITNIEGGILAGALREADNQHFMYQASQCPMSWTNNSDSCNGIEQHLHDDDPPACQSHWEAYRADVAKGIELQVSTRRRGTVIVV
ncbi:hypothetical protein FGB62_9g34 [Gracilaria domingensis]|nr:hypothetical protein FGB62_9g34 [Gracilaria domingensis]